MASVISTSPAKRHPAVYNYYNGFLATIAVIVAINSSERLNVKLGFPPPCTPLATMTTKKRPKERPKD